MPKQILMAHGLKSRILPSLFALVWALNAYGSDLEKYRPTGVLPISATWKDDATGRDLPVTATLTTFTEDWQAAHNRDYVPDKIFAFSNVHLTGGKDLSVGGKNIEPWIIGRRKDPFLDLEVLEIDNTQLKAQPFAYYQPRTKKFLARHQPLEAWLGGSYERALSRRQENILKLSPADTGEFTLRPEWTKKDQSESVEKYTLPASYENDTYGSPFTVEYSRANHGVYLATGDLVRTPGRISPGTSGSPLMLFELDGGRVTTPVRGIAAAFTRGMQGSYFISDLEMGRLYEEYREKGSGSRNDVKWLYWNGEGYRSSAEFSEIALTTGTAGNGTYGNPGNGTYGNPADSEANTPLPYSFVWRGKPATALKVTSPFGPSFILFPGYSAFAVALKYRQQLENEGFNISPVSPGESLVDQLKQNVGATSDKFISKSDTLHVCILEQPTIISDGKTITITVPSPPPAGGPIRLVLNPDGSVAGNPRAGFTPFPEVKAPNGRNYRFDLRSLFFVDLDATAVRSKQEIPKYRLPHEFGAELISLLKQSQTEGAFMSIRDLTNGNEFRFRFASATVYRPTYVDTPCAADTFQDPLDTETKRLLTSLQGPLPQLCRQ